MSDSIIMHGLNMVGSSMIGVRIYIFIQPIHSQFMSQQI